MAISLSDRPLAARLYGYGLAGLLALGSLAGMAGTLVAIFDTHEGEALQGENRRLGALPEMPRTLAEWNTFPRRFEVFVDDHFGLRAALVRTHTAISTVLLDKLPTNQVVTGTNGWLFYAGEGSLSLFQRTVQLDADRLDQWRAQLAERQRMLDERGIGYAFTIAPDKHTIYGEYMPGYLRQGRNPSPHDQVVAATRADDLPVVDLRPDLKAAKTEPHADGLPLYMRDDTHWNERGAAVAYRALMSRLGRRPLALDDSAFRTRPNGPGDLAKMAQIDRLEDVPEVRREALPCVVRETERTKDELGHPGLIRTRCDGADGKLLLFRDSFGEALLPFLSASFGEVVAVWTMPSTETFARLVEAEKPDVVIEERVERYLRYTPRATDISPIE